METEGIEGYETLSVWDMGTSTKWCRLSVLLLVQWMTQKVRGIVEHEETQSNTCSFEVFGDPLFASNWAGFNGSLS